MANSKRWTGLQFGQNLRLERDRRHWTQEQLAQKLRDAGLQSHWATISKIENGERSVRIDEAAAIADLFDNMSIDALVGRTANREADAVYTLRKAAQLVTQCQWQNEASAQQIRECIDDLNGTHPVVATQLAAVADAADNVANLASTFGGSDGTINDGTQAALRALLDNDSADDET